MNIPPIDWSTYKKYEDEVGSAAEITAKKSCEDAAEIERKCNYLLI